MNSGASDDVAPRNYRQEYEVAIFVVWFAAIRGYIQDYGNVGDRFPAVTYEDALNEPVLSSARAGRCRGRRGRTRHSESARQ